MKTVGFLSTWLAAGLAVTIWGEAANAIPLAGAMRGQSIVRIQSDRGGFVIQYALKMQALKKAGTPVQFTGGCLSACTLYLALPTNQTCISRWASFSFHAAYGASPSGNAIATAYMMRLYPAWVRSWINSQGGLTRRLITMPREYVSKHMKECEPGKAIAQKQNRTIWRSSARALQPVAKKRNFAKAASL